MAQYTVQKGDTLSQIGQKLGVDWRKITGYKSGNPNLIYPGEILNLPGAEKPAETITPGPTSPTPSAEGTTPASQKTIGGLIASPLQEAVTGGTTFGAAGEQIKPAPTPSASDDLVGRLTKAITGAEGVTTLREEKKTLEEEKGVAGMRETVGSFEEEIAKTQSLLDQLETDITQRTREYLVSEPQRRRIMATEQEPLIKQLGTLERGYTTAGAKLQRTETDILTELGLIEKERTTPLELLEREVKIRSDIKNLTDKKIPNTVSSTFNEDGDLTIVTQDPETGAFSTQTMKGIGDKANKYQSITSTTDENGNLSIIGVKVDGTPEILGTFKGVSKSAGSEETKAKQDMDVQLSAVSGKDGYVSPENWKSAMNAWRAAGLDINKFIKQFSGYVNPTDPQDYGIGTTPESGRSTLQQLLDKL